MPLLHGGGVEVSGKKENNIKVDCVKIVYRILKCLILLFTQAEWGPVMDL
jgi:hypothetical protein